MQNDEKDTPTNELAKRLFWTTRTLELLVILPLLLPQFYYLFFLPALAMPTDLINWLTDFFPVFGKLQEQFQADEYVRRASTYVLILVVGVLSLPFGLWKGLQYACYDKIYKERFEKEYLVRQKANFQRSSSPLGVLAMSGISILIAFGFWIFYNQTDSIFWASAPFLGFLPMCVHFINLYIKRSWRFS